jgi:hypothetical protein
MHRQFSVGVLAALLSAGLSAQQIIITTSTWVIFPGSQQIFNTFFGSNPQGDFVMGGCLSQVGTSASASFHTANASFQGFSAGGGGSVSGGLPPQTATATESYSRQTPGTVTTSLTAQMSPASFINQTGAGNRVAANATVSISCPAFALSASASARVLPGSGGLFLSTAPQSATATVTGINSWFLAMSATCDTIGTISNAGGQVQISCICDVSGGVILN